MENTGPKPVTLSVCMMVRDEEKNLHTCLSSLAGIYDELIVVDTGSVDETVSIAKSFSAKVYHHPWEDDFSKHRNQSIGYATGDWVLIIDADEELIITNPSLLKEWLADLPPDCQTVAVAVKDIQQDRNVMQFNSVRLFRRGSVQYSGIIHNAPVVVNGKAEAVFLPEVHLRHYGYDMSPELAAKKRARTEGLLLKRIKQNPDDIAAYFYLVQGYSAYGEFEKAAKYVEQYRTVAERTQEKFNGSIYCTAFHVYRKLGDRAKAKEWLLEGMSVYPKDLDLLMALTEFGVWVADVNLISKGARGFIRVYDEYQKNPIACGNRFTYANTPESLSYCLFHLSMAVFQEGCILLDKLKDTLTKAKPEFQEGITHDVQFIFERFGLTKQDWCEPSFKKVVNL
jgi:glycosyltransferase involved in cell wall biosynthesis